MRSSVAKHFHPLLGRRLVDWVILTAREAGAERVIVVVSPDGKGQFPDDEIAVQERPLGTGDALRAAESSLEGFEGDVLVLSGDVPGLTSRTVEELIETHRSKRAAATVLSFEPPDARSYGRIVRDGLGGVARIVEARDANPNELALREVNSGIYVFQTAKLWPALARIGSDNAQGEIYATDTIGLLVDDGDPVAAHIAADPFEVEGINTRAELAAVAAGLRDRINLAHMLAGVSIVDPTSTWIEPTVTIEPDATIHPFVVLRGSTVVRTGAEIHPHSVVWDAQVGGDASVGPFCYLRPGTVLEAASKAGTYVEIKNSNLGPGAKVPHLSYIGDAEIGEGTNIGAGGITANFPHREGLPKGRTRIGRNVRTGIHNGFVAPVEVGDGAWTAAGTVITKNVPEDALAVARVPQENKEGYAARNRED